MRRGTIMCFGVEVLLAAGADVAVKDAQSRTALHVAAASGVTHVASIVRFFVRADGAENEGCR